MMSPFRSSREGGSQETLIEVEDSGMAETFCGGALGAIEKAAR